LAASQSSSTFTISDISQSLGVTLAAIAGVMSACGPKQTWTAAPHMSAFGGKADMTFCGGMSAFDPKQTSNWKAAIAADTVGNLT
jgi:hypothetical protein